MGVMGGIVGIPRGSLNRNDVRVLRPWRGGEHQRDARCLGQRVHEALQRREESGYFAGSRRRALYGEGDEVDRGFHPGFWNFWGLHEQTIRTW